MVALGLATWWCEGAGSCEASGCKLPKVLGHDSGISDGDHFSGLHGSTQIGSFRDVKALFDATNPLLLKTLFFVHLLVLEL